MGWYVTMSLLLDDRIKFLVGFIFMAIIIAIVLFVVEGSLRKKEHRKNRQLQQTPEDRIKIYMASTKSVQDKLAFIDKTGKDYFRDMYGFPDTSSYSFLVKKLEKEGNKREIEFCKEMFSAFYSEEELSREHIKEIAKMLIEIEGHRTAEKEDLEKITTEKIKIPAINIKNKMKEKEEELSEKLSNKTDMEDKEIISNSIKKMAQEDELVTKRNIDEIKKEDEKFRYKKRKIEDLRKEGEKKFDERKELVDDRRSRRANAEKEKRRKRELEKKRRDDEKQRRREMYWRAEAEKQERRKERDRQKGEGKVLEQQKRELAQREAQRLKEEKFDKLKMEQIGISQNNGPTESSPKNEGIASRIVRLEKERLGHSS